MSRPGVYREPGGSKQAGEGRERRGKYALLTRPSFGAVIGRLLEPHRSLSGNEKAPPPSHTRFDESRLWFCNFQKYPTCISAQTGACVIVSCTAVDIPGTSGLFGKQKLAVAPLTSCPGGRGGSPARRLARTWFWLEQSHSWKV